MRDGGIYLYTYTVDRKDIRSQSISYILHLLSSFQSQVSLSHYEGIYKKGKRKSQFNKMPCSLCSLTIHLSLSWVNSRCVRNRLLRAVTTTSKMRHTLQEEYEILIKLVRLWIGSPQLQRWELHCSQHRRLTPGLPATLRWASSHFLSKCH